LSIAINTVLRYRAACDKPHMAELQVITPRI